ncbi:MAG: group II intron reverse transcriptase/maturase, partial [Serratia sp. (in: enterobacteria)]|uniref:group II intron reverse transcriptase/maturase n=1 Tax=Serratia sp. (in: enterobacteria) TaxID=616 RepID=UPI003F2A7ABF
MKLLEEILSDENLELACKQVIKNKGAAGVDKMMAFELRGYLKDNQEALKESIRTRKYQPKPVRRVEIPKDDGTKRQLGIPCVVDRFIQQAIAQKLSPIYEEQFSEHSYGFRPNRGAHNAIEAALAYFNQGIEWVVDIDLEKFFDRVNHDKLIQIVSEKVQDGDVVSLIRKFLTSGIMIEDEYKEAVIGTPQGGPLSPLLGNIILDKLDKELESRNLRFARYADDCLIFVGTEKAANRVMNNISRFIEEELLLRVNMT